MIRRHPWYFVFLIFVILCLINIFQKLQWHTPTDNIVWEDSKEGLVCLKAPEEGPIKKGDILLAVSKYSIKDKIDLNRVIAKKKTTVTRLREMEL